jgi:hypothetical protein
MEAAWTHRGAVLETTDTPRPVPALRRNGRRPRLIREHTPRLALAIGCELDAPSRGWERALKASLHRLKLHDLAGATLWAVISAIAKRRAPPW